MVRGLNALAVSRFTDNPTQRPVESGAPDGNRTHVSRISSGVLSQLNYGTVREANLTDAVLSRAHHMARFGK
jgi:hypothetical protein